MTYEELGKKVKEKYPQYADTPDNELGKQVAEKYPQYQKQITEPKKGIEQQLGEGRWLPAGLGILGAVAAGPLGAGLGGFYGEDIRQRAAKGQIEKSIIPPPLRELLFPETRPTKEEVVGQLQTGAQTALWEALFPPITKGVGKVVGGVTKPIREALRPAKEAIGRQIAAQVVQPTKGMIRKDLAEKGISETLEEMEKRGVTGTAREIFVKSGINKKNVWSKITGFLKNYKRRLPKIQMDDVVSVLDDQIDEAKLLGNVDEVAELRRLKKFHGGRVTFKQAYDTIKAWGTKSRSYYAADKAPVDIKPFKAKAFFQMSNKGRAVLKDVTEEGFPQWGQMMDDYHFWSNAKTFAESGVAAAQTAISSPRGLLQRGVPLAIEGGRGVGRGLETTGQALGRAAPNLWRTLTFPTAARSSAVPIHRPAQRPKELRR